MRSSIAVAVGICACLGACSSPIPQTSSSPQGSGGTPVTPPSGGTPGTTAAAGTPAPGGAGDPAAVSGGGGPAPAKAGTPAPSLGGMVAMPGAGHAAEGGAGAGVLVAGSGAGAASEAGSSAPSGSATGPFPPVSDFNKDGPYMGAMLGNTGPNNNYTIHYPKELAPNGAKNPIVGWMSGGGTTPDLYPLLPRLATHGFVVVASNTVPGIGDEANLGQEIIAGIDWAIAENAREGSPFFGKLDTTKLASAGYSMGSLATFTIANDPRLTTTLHISGGNMAPERVNNLHAPAAFLCGVPGDDSCNILSTDCDIAASNCDIDFNNAKTPVFYANFPGGHLGILTPPLQDQIQTEAVAWLRWQLMGDTTLKSRFVGDQCGVCKDSNWKVKQKNWQ